MNAAFSLPRPIIPAADRLENAPGFDDVRSLFPETQRMSIHRKDERYGHFSVQISPSSSRVPWHGVAVLVPSEKGLMLDIRLERERQNGRNPAWKVIHETSYN